MNVDLRAELGILDLCAGFGMLAEAARIALEHLGYRSRIVAHVERDSAAAAALVARMAAAPVDRAPVCDDLATFDGRPWRGIVDLLCAGLPCQPYSLAGKRLGNIDERSHGEDGDGPIVHFLRIVGECRPAVVFLENVSAWVVGGHFRSVGEELCRLGYTIKDPVFLAAEDVGAPHQRERVFIMAYLHGAGRHGDAEQHGGSLEYQPQHPDRGHALRRGLQLADGDGSGRRAQGNASKRSGRINRSGGELGDAERADARAGERGEQGQSPQKWRCGSANTDDGLPLFPPGRGDPDDPDHPDWWAWAAVAAVDASRMPRTQSPLPMVADGMAAADLLRIGGNGVVPLAAACAFCALWADAFGGTETGACRMTHPHPDGRTKERA